LYYHEDPARFDQLCRYNHTDVEVERELYGILPPLSPTEAELWGLDQRVNALGVPFDRVLIEAARKIVAAARPEIDGEIAAITGGAVVATSQVPALKSWLRQQGCTSDTLDKKTITALLAGELPPAVCRVLELRLMGGRAAVKKFDAVLKCLDRDDRAR